MVLEQIQLILVVNAHARKKATKMRQLKKIPKVKASDMQKYLGLSSEGQGKQKIPK